MKIINIHQCLKYIFEHHNNNKVNKESFKTQII